MNNKKKLSVALGAIVLLILSIVLFNKKVNPPQAVEQNVALEQPVVPNNTVLYKDGFFMPANMSIKAGTTISFINESDEELWVAANPHPAHTSLPGFDAKRGYKKGEVYKYTFNKKGSFGYHNHLNPQSRGTLTVN